MQIIYFIKLDVIKSLINKKKKYEFAQIVIGL